MSTESKAIEMYQNPDGQFVIDVKVENDTVWLNRAQIANLFERDIKTIGKHINNALREELNNIPVVAKFATTASDGKTYNVAHYNLEMITSIGYRVKSQQGVFFRMWANKILKDYLVKGYAINDKIKLEQYEDLKSTIKIMANILHSRKLEHIEAEGLLQVISDYGYALDTLDRYDYQTLQIENTTIEDAFKVTYSGAMNAIEELREKFGGSNLFAKEKDDSFKSSIATLYQTFAGNPLYPSVEEKAAMFLYLVVKNHSFTDGNKRIAAFLFLWFMEKNKILYNTDGTKRIENNTLVALTLMIAESKSNEMEIMVKVIVNLINKNN